MAPASNLSSAAEALLNAVTLKRYDVPYFACPKSIDQTRSDTAAVLRAAADQVISPLPPPCEDFDEYAQGFLAAHVKYRAEFLAIAAELETSTTENR